MTGGDRRAVEKAFIKAGVKEVTLVESPLSLLAYTGSIGGLFLDIGGGKTEVAAVTNRGIACGVTVNIAGDAFNAAIIDAMYTNYGVKLGDYTVEKIKTSALSFYLNDEGSYAVSGGGKDGAPRSVAITASDMRDAVLPLVDNIIEVVMNVLDQTPPELAAEILRKGIFLTGGSSRIPGLQEYLEQGFRASSHSALRRSVQCGDRRREIPRRQAFPQRPPRRQTGLRRGGARFYCRVRV